MTELQYNFLPLLGGGQQCVQFQLLSDPISESLKNDIADIRTELRGR
jgi:hypothetical protein